MSEKSALIPIGLFNKLTEYLSSRPYGEVYNLIDDLRQNVQVVDTKEEVESEESDE